MLIFAAIMHHNSRAKHMSLKTHRVIKNNVSHCMRILAKVRSANTQTTRPCTSLAHLCAILASSRSACSSPSGTLMLAICLSLVLTKFSALQRDRTLDLVPHGYSNYKSIRKAQIHTHSYIHVCIVVCVQACTCVCARIYACFAMCASIRAMCARSLYGTISNTWLSNNFLFQNPASFLDWTVRRGCGGTLRGFRTHVAAAGAHTKNENPHNLKKSQKERGIFITVRDAAAGEPI